ncbi:monocarboxylate transporter 11-like [Patiria miniata]|uniref:Uncharacterized protein n=1 Tax=Patiria miniata TaxID=46514 RepID=A0A914BF76_PATMI|nr:monocarboxylate transporter 11-like [Patiria miniata]
MITLCCAPVGKDEDPGPLPEREERRRWLVLLAAYLSFLLWEGLCKSLGIMLQSIAVQLNTETWPVGSAIGIMLAARGLTGPLLRALEVRWQYHQIALVSGLVAGVGVIGASFARTLLQFAACLVLVTGPAFGLVLNISLVLLGQYFHRLYACANGLAYSGASIGILVYAPVSQILLDTYGWQGALLLVGGIQLHLIALGSLQRPPSCHRRGEVGYREVGTDHVLRERHEPSASELNRHISANGRGSCLKFCLKFSKAMGLDLFLDLSYLTLILCMGNLCFVNIAWIVYTVPHLIAKDLTTSSSTTVVWAGGIGILVGQLGHGLLVDFKLLKGRLVMYLANLLMGCTLLCDPLLFGKWPLAASNFFFGLGLGIGLPLTYTLMRDVVGVARMTNAVGWAEMTGGVFRILSSFLTGWLYDKLGSYDLSFVFLGSSSCVVVVILMTEDIYRLIQRRISNRVAPI